MIKNKLVTPFPRPIRQTQTLQKLSKPPTKPNPHPLRRNLPPNPQQNETTSSKPLNHHKNCQLQPRQPNILHGLAKKSTIAAKVANHYHPADTTASSPAEETFRGQPQLHAGGGKLPQKRQPRAKPPGPAGGRRLGTVANGQGKCTNYNCGQHDQHGQQGGVDKPTKIGYPHRFDKTRRPPPQQRFRKSFTRPPSTQPQQPPRSQLTSESERIGGFYASGQGPGGRPRDLLTK